MIYFVFVLGCAAATQWNAPSSTVRTWCRWTVVTVALLAMLFWSQW